MARLVSVSIALLRKPRFASLTIPIRLPLVLWWLAQMLRPFGWLAMLIREEGNKDTHGVSEAD
jgi:hypothetical protein